MVELGPASEPEMVLAFLQGEIDSPRFGHLYRGLLARAGHRRRELIDQPDLQNPRHNALRLALLQAVRGYRADHALFAGFPPDVQWRRARMAPPERARWKYVNSPAWIALSGGTRLVLDGARNLETVEVPDDPKPHIRAVVAALPAGRQYPPLIMVEGPAGFLVLVEGHVRATAYVVADLPADVELLVGTSPTLASWQFY